MSRPNLRDFYGNAFKEIMMLKRTETLLNAAIKKMIDEPKKIVTIKCDAGVDVSDGYHSFDDLYEHRFELWIALCLEIEPRRMPWRARLHDDGTSYPGWFVLGIGADPGRIVTYHLPDRLWDRCDFAQTVERAAFDGHTSEDVLKRLRDL